MFFTPRCKGTALVGKKKESDSAEGSYRVRLVRSWRLFDLSRPRCRGIYPRTLVQEGEYLMTVELIGGKPWLVMETQGGRIGAPYGCFVSAQSNFANSSDRIELARIVLAQAPEIPTG